MKRAALAAGLPPVFPWEVGCRRATVRLEFDYPQFFQKLTASLCRLTGGGSWISSAPLPCPSYAKFIPNRTPVDRNANFCADSPFYRTRKNSKTSHFWPLISDMNPKKLSQTVSFRRTFAINPAAIQSLIRWKTILKSSFVAGAPKDLILFTKDDQRIARTFQFVSKSESNPAETLLRVSDESRIWTGLKAVNGLTG